MKKWILALGLVIALVGGLFALSFSPAPDNGSAGGGNSNDLGAIQQLAAGQVINGIKCESGEMLTYHVHAHLDIVVSGQKISVPAGIGIGRPWQTDGAGFVGSGSCFSWLHTHDASGVIHIEAPSQATFTLGQLFDLWGVKFDDNNLGGHVVSGPDKLTAYINGEVVSGNLRDIKLAPHEEIVVNFGSSAPSPVASSYTFAPGQ